MKIYLSIFVLLVSFSSADSITPKEFSGLWYEIARTENPYEKNCVAATVEYRLTSNDGFDVTNRCFDGKLGGDLIVYNGSAKTLEKNSAKRLKLTYFWLFSQQYELIHLDPSKRYAIMASDDFKYIWIMSRTPIIPKPALDKALQKLASRLDLNKLIYTPQDKQGRYQ